MGIAAITCNIPDFFFSLSLLFSSHKMRNFSYNADVCSLSAFCQQHCLKGHESTELVSKLIPCFYLQKNQKNILRKSVEQFCQILVFRYERSHLNICKAQGNKSYVWGCVVSYGLSGNLKCDCANVYLF